MSNRLYDFSIYVYLVLGDIKQKMEHGDADSAGSTLRTVGVVTLVLLIVSILGAAVYEAAAKTAGAINTANFGNFN